MNISFSFPNTISVLFVLFQFLGSNSFAQNKLSGTFYINWGYNREAYSKSTLHLYKHSSDQYDFKMIRARAHDKNNFEHIGRLDELTIPQYNFHAGYLFNDKRNLGVEISWDHLKYVVEDNQVVRVIGDIRGRAIDKDTLVDPNFVHIQHTNGNNYLMLNLVKKTSLWRHRNMELSWHNKVGAGILYSYTISTVLGNYDKGHFRTQGYVLGLGTGLRFDICRYFFLEANTQGAFANYLSTELGADHKGRLEHHFYSAAAALQFGFSYPIGPGLPKVEK